MKPRRLVIDQFNLKPVLINVVYADGKVDKVGAEQLDELIQSKKIKKFQRSDKWVTLGIDPVRKTGESDFVIRKGEKITKGSKRQK